MKNIDEAAQRQRLQAWREAQLADLAAKRAKYEAISLASAVPSRSASTPRARYIPSGKRNPKIFYDPVDGYPVLIPEPDFSGEHEGVFVFRFCLLMLWMPLLALAIVYWS